MLIINILGDICPPWGFKKSKDFNPFCIEIESILKNSDVVIANLECPVTNTNKPIVKCGPNLKANINDIEKIKCTGITALALANNHILDYDEQGILDTIEIAKDLSMLTYGAGKDSTEASKPAFVSCKGQKIGMLAFAEEEFNCATAKTAGANLFDPYISLKEIEDVKSQCDYLIVNYHGGIEHYRFPSPLLQKKCRAMADAGADIILCQHSHCIGTYEEYNSSMILYGQGNAVFGRREGNEAWNTGLLVTVKLSDKKPHIEFRVFEAMDKGIAFVSKEKNIIRLRQMEEESKQLNDSEFIKDKWNEFCQNRASAYLPQLCCWSRITNKLNRMTKNLLARLFLNKNKQRVVMNQIRCDSHREVLRTILESNVFSK